ncbi:MAG TPA: hypothetical protein V6C81_24755 [Planktothrix sp.]|jgi:hypothetical protein
MYIVLKLLAIQGLLGAFDTLYYHEWRAKLPGAYEIAAPELRLHAARDFIYTIIFGTLPFLEWHGAWAGLLGIVLCSEIVITLADFAVEPKVRLQLGGVPAGEKTTHAVMAIVYAVILVNLVPIILSWSGLPTEYAPCEIADRLPLRYCLSAMAFAVMLSGLRDLLSSYGIKSFAWPWADRR